MENQDFFKEIEKINLETPNNQQLWLICSKHQKESSFFCKHCKVLLCIKCLILHKCSKSYLQEFTTEELDTELTRIQQYLQEEINTYDNCTL